MSIVIPRGTNGFVSYQATRQNKDSHYLDNKDKPAYFPFIIPILT